MDGDNYNEREDYSDYVDAQAFFSGDSNWDKQTASRRAEPLEYVKATFVSVHRTDAARSADVLSFRRKNYATFFLLTHNKFIRRSNWFHSEACA